jgi:hypothetical protein
MATIRYTKTFFNEPDRISEEDYNSMKRVLCHNPNFEIDPNPETFSEHFSDSLKTIKICGIIMGIGAFIGGVLSKGQDWALFVGMTMTLILGITPIMFTLYYLLLEGPSFATYLKKKKEYFSRMKYAILNTNSYREFSMTFYRF